MLVFKNKYGSWETLFKSKNGNEVLKYYVSVSFRKLDEPIKDSININPIEWWGSCFKTKDGVIKPKLFIHQWQEIIEQPKEAEQRNDFEYTDDINNLPFY